MLVSHLLTYTAWLLHTFKTDHLTLIFITNSIPQKASWESCLLEIIGLVRYTINFIHHNGKFHQLHLVHLSKFSTEIICERKIFILAHDLRGSETHQPVLLFLDLWWASTSWQKAVIQQSLHHGSQEAERSNKQEPMASYTLYRPSETCFFQGGLMVNSSTSQSIQNLNPPMDWASYLWECLQGHRQECALTHLGVFQPIKLKRSAIIDTKDLFVEAFETCSSYFVN